MSRVQVIASSEDATDPSGSERTAILQPFPVPGRPDGEWMTDGKEGYKARYFLRMVRPADGRVAYLSQSVGCATPEEARTRILETADRIDAYRRDHTDATFLRQALADWQAGKRACAPIREARWILGAEYVNPLRDTVWTAHAAKREAEEAAQAEERAKREAEAASENQRIALAGWEEGKNLAPAHWEILASLAEYDWHPRTLGTLRAKVQTLSSKGEAFLSYPKGHKPDTGGVWNAIAAINAALSAKLGKRPAGMFGLPPLDETPEASPEQLAHLFGQ